MKKKYVKPELFYEHYELSQHIADCTWEWVNLTSETTCHADPDPEKLFISGDEYRLFAVEGVCSLLSGQYSDYCYENYDPGASLFKS